MSSWSAAAIVPLYWLSEKSVILRGSSVRPAIQRTLARLSDRTGQSARRVFDAARPADAFVDPALLGRMYDNRPARPTRRDTRLPAEKAMSRATEVHRSIRRFVPRDARLFELAAGDGLVATALSELGYRPTATDLVVPSASLAIPFLKMDAARLEIADASVDGIYSFDAFEHFADPHEVLRESYRVLRPGGVVYASFGPLYHSPHGAHQWFSVDLPYVHMLFEGPVLDAFADERGLKRITRNLNYWSLAQYRRLFEDARAMGFEIVWKFEKRNVAFADLIIEHAATLKRRVGDFDELVIRSIEVLLRKG